MKTSLNENYLGKGIHGKQILLKYLVNIYDNTKFRIYKI